MATKPARALIVRDVAIFSPEDWLALSVHAFGDAGPVPPADGPPPARRRAPKPRPGREAAD